MMPRDPALNLLVLAGTSEGRTVISRLASDPSISITASLAGATTAPKPLPVPVITGGFGGAEGLARYCRDHNIDAIADVTHPFARHISRNAREAATTVGIPCIQFDRPEWPLAPGWRSFDDWPEMVATVPSAARVFLAGGTASITAFTVRDDIWLWARALNVADCVDTERVTYLNAMPHTNVSDEVELFTRLGITHLCCKNSGGDASRAKIDAAQTLGLPVWLLGRHRAQKDVHGHQIYDNLDDVVAAIENLKQRRAHS